MNGFVGTALFLKIALVFNLKTAFSHRPNRFIFQDNLFPHLGDPNEQFGTHDKLPWVSKVSKKNLPN